MRPPTSRSKFGGNGVPARPVPSLPAPHSRNSWGNEGTFAARQQRFATAEVPPSGPTSGGIDSPFWQASMIVAVGAPSCSRGAGFDGYRDGQTRADVVTFERFGSAAIAPPPVGSGPFCRNWRSCPLAASVLEIADAGAAVDGGAIPPRRPRPCRIVSAGGGRPVEHRSHGRGVLHRGRIGEAGGVPHVQRAPAGELPRRRVPGVGAADTACRPARSRASRPRRRLRRLRDHGAKCPGGLCASASATNITR